MAERGHLHVTVDPEILRAARAKRKATGQSLSHVVSEALREWISESLPEGSQELTGEATQGRRRVLLVDDDPLFLKVTQHVLMSDGYEVTTAQAGNEALALIREEKPDLVVLDIMMDTVLDGIWVSKRMSEDDDLRRIPVIMVSSIASTEYASLFPQDEYLNAVDFLFKPVQPADLLASIGRFLR